MTTIQIKVSEALVTRYGVKALQERVQREMEWEEMRLLAEEYQKSLQETGIDDTAMIEKSRGKAWDKFKADNSNLFQS
ncbi:MAG: hypothetical protein U0X91_15705 [Spirosomataceae bacterium]